MLPTGQFLNHTNKRSGNFESSLNHALFQTINGMTSNRPIFIKIAVIIPCSHINLNASPNPNPNPNHRFICHVLTLMD